MVDHFVSHFVSLPLLLRANSSCTIHHHPQRQTSRRCGSVHRQEGESYFTSAAYSVRMILRLSSWVRVVSSLSWSSTSRLISFPILRSILRSSLTIISRSIFSRSWATVMIGRGPRRLPFVLEAVLFVPLLLLLLMVFILPSFVRSVKLEGKSCGRFVDMWISLGLITQHPSSPHAFSPIIAAS